MKLDKIAFAEMISWFGHRMKSAMTTDELIWLDAHIYIDVPPMGAEPIIEMFEAIAANKKIEAIKHYRNITNQNLVNSKNAIELLTNKMYDSKDQFVIRMNAKLYSDETPLHDKPIIEKFLRQFS